MHLSLELWLCVAVLAAGGVAGFRPGKSPLAIRPQRALSMTRGDGKSIGLPNWLQGAATDFYIFQFHRLILFGDTYQIPLSFQLEVASDLVLHGLEV